MNFIDEKDVSDVIPLSKEQEGILYHYNSNKNRSLYNVQLIFQIEGEINYHIFSETWIKIIEINEILRTVFRWKKIKQPCQIILKKVQPEILFLANSDDDLNIQEIAKKEREKEFDLEKNSFRILLSTNNSKNHVLILTYHHIILDGWSNLILIDEFLEIYSKLIEEKQFHAKVKPSIKSLVEYINLRNEQHEKYWKKSFENFDSHTGIPVSNYNLKTESQTSGCYNGVISNNIKDKIVNYSKENKITIASLLYCAWGLVLRKYKDSNDIVFCNVQSRRNSEKVGNIENLLGLITSTLPFRIKYNSNDTVLENISQISDSLNQQREHQFSSLIEIKGLIPGFQNTNSLDTILIIENYPNNYKKLSSNQHFQIKSFEHNEQTHYNLAISIRLFDNFEINILYDKGKFEARFIENLYYHLENTIIGIINNPNITINKLELLSAIDKQIVIQELNDTKKDIVNSDIAHLFENQVLINNDKIALKQGELELTYNILNKESNKVANLLISRGAGKGEIVGICMDRSLDLIIGLIGILKSGSSFVPIDVNYPDKRIKYLLDDSKPSIAIIQDDLASKFNKIQKELNIISIKEAENFASVFKLPTIESSDLAYIMYTSGSTGIPKGVMVEQANVLNFIEGICSKIEFDDNSSFFALTTICFDIFILEVILPILKGYRIYLVNSNEQNDPFILCKLLIKYTINVLQLTPSRLRAIIETDENLNSLNNLDSLLIGGETLPPDLLNRTKKSFKNKIYNVYGPTETSIWSSVKDVSGSNELSIGKPIINTQFYVLDSNKSIQPIEIPGGLYIGGKGVARGYLNKVELTNEMFITSLINGQRIYRTGDQVKIDYTGNVVHLGRLDSQVKIRGYRIELGEIETALDLYPAINSSVVLVKEDKDIKYLCAYYTSSTIISVEEITMFLREKGLPDYMIPSCFIFMKQFPITDNNKINRKLLPEPQKNINSEIILPTNNVQKEVIKIWAQLLKIEDSKISINDNFYFIGGHSLNATLLIASIQKHFNVEVTMSDFVLAPSVKALSELIQNSNPTYINIDKINLQSFELSPIQKQLFFIQTSDVDHVVYNMFQLFELSGDLDILKINKIFNELVKRHSALRTCFKLIDDVPTQVIENEIEFNIRYIKIDTFDKAEIIGKYIRPFALNELPLMRVYIFDLENKNICYLLFDIHHIISDEFSSNILMDEFFKLLNDEKLQPLKFQFIDYVGLLKKQNQLNTKKREFWLNKLSKRINQLDLPKDYENSSTNNFAGDTLLFDIDSDQRDNLLEIAQQEKTSMYTVLLSIFTILLNKITCQEDIIIGTDVSGRKYSEFINCVGTFINIIPIRCNLNQSDTFKDHLSKVNKEVINCLDNQDYNLQDIINELKLEKTYNNNPLFNVMFSFNTYYDKILYEGISNGKWQMQPIPLDNELKLSKFDLTLSALDKKSSINFQIEYSTLVFNSETIKKISQYYKKIIDIIIVDSNQIIDEIELIKIEEKYKLSNIIKNTSNFVDLIEFKSPLVDKYESLLLNIPV